VGWIDAELVLVALAAMLSPTTLGFSVLALVMGDRPRRTGLWFYLGALTATLAVGVIAAFVIGDIAASKTPSQPKTWVAIVDIVAAIVLAVWTVRVLRRPPDQKRIEGMVAQMSKVANSPVIAIIGAGAALANPGAFIPLALKDISETHPSTTQYIVAWVFFSLVSLLPLAIAIVMLFVAPERAERTLQASRDWLLRNRRKVAVVVVFLLVASLLRNGIAGLTN
jgi:Sap, sulfolipid-1-addressing protein